MTRQIIASTFIALLLLTAPVFSDVVLNFSMADSPATTRPSVDSASVSVLAVPGHEFYTKFSSNDRTFEVSGTVQVLADRRYRVKIRLDRRDKGLESVSTTVELKAGEAFNLSGLQSGTFAQMTMLTVKPNPA